MSPISRRIFVYWLLLLVPALVVGGGAILLLRREQGRLTELGAYAAESRRTAVAARARLIAENVELLIGDVEEGLVDALAGEPAAGIDGFLERWEKTNPLVRTAFRCRPDGRLLWPDATAGGAEQRGFARRFPRLVAVGPPWFTAATPPTATKDQPQKKILPEEEPARQQVAMNVAQMQSARRDVQELLKTSNSLSQAPAPAVAYDLSRRSSESQQFGSAKAETAGAAIAGAPARPGAEPSTADRQSQPILASRAESANAPAPPPKLAAPDRRGWWPQPVDGHLHLIGWVQPGGAGEVRGVELEMAALITRLANTLPAEVEVGAGYALRDDQGRVMHQVGAIPRNALAAARVPLALTLLPGWDVVAYLDTTPGSSLEGGGFFGISVLLVAIFVAAIVAGGSLLVWQVRRSEQEAAQKTSFVANVSHEFKTPLTTIRLYAELLEQGRVRNAAQGTDYLRTIGRETQRLARLVNNALDFSRLEEGRKKYALEAFELVAELARLLDTHAPRVAEAGLALQRELPAPPVRVTTDRDALEQIVLNLLDNACKYARAGGEVTVALAGRAAGGAEIRVADRGPGVPAEHHERIFEKFHRVDDALTAEKTGAGLGLSIARQLARGLGGELRYAPAEGGGAEFILELP